MKKDKFLTIGALAKTTGTKVKALRYYEKIGVLIPSYVDSDNGYRYYSRRHIYIVEAVRLCADLNIPLNEFKKFISEDESQIQTYALIEQGILRANQKIAELQDTIKKLEDVQEDIEKSKQLISEINGREMILSEKDYWIMPFDGFMSTKEYYTTLSDIYDDVEAHGLSFAEKYQEGMLLLKKNQTLSTYVYIALEKAEKNTAIQHIIRIPANRYICKITASQDIKESSNLFFSAADEPHDMLIFLNEIFTETFNLDSPLFEAIYLRKNEAV